MSFLDNSTLVCKECEREWYCGDYFLRFCPECDELLHMKNYDSKEKAKQHSYHIVRPWRRRPSPDEPELNLDFQ